MRVTLEGQVSLVMWEATTSPLLPRIRPSPFARTLRKWRSFRCLTLVRAAAILGCTVPMLCKYEHGRNEPPVHRRAAIFAIIED